MRTIVKKLLCFWAMLPAFIHGHVTAQDTMRLTLPEAERLFLKNNLALLAERYNIDIAEAQIIQARLYNNPNFQFTGTIYNPVQKKGFDISNKTGEYIIGAQQLILLAGKRNKQIQLAQTGSTLSSNSFYDLLRTLRFSLRSDFYQAYYLYNSITAYQGQIKSLEQLNTTFQQLLAKDLVTLKDAVRIKSLLYSLKSEQTLLLNQFNDIQSEIQQLLQSNRTIVIPVADEGLLNSPALNQIPLQGLIDSAFNNRYDLKFSQNAILYNQQNLALQKSLATPDLTVGAQFDKRGSFVDNASFLTLSIDLPFFNRNQGNIKAARIAVDQSRLRADKQIQTVENEVSHAYLNAINADKMLQSIEPGFRTEFEQLLKTITYNFEKRNISLLEFTDFYESYKQNILQLNQVQNARMQALEALNFAVGKTITNY